MALEQFLAIATRECYSLKATHFRILPDGNQSYTFEQGQWKFTHTRDSSGRANWGNKSVSINGTIVWIMVFLGIVLEHSQVSPRAIHEFLEEVRSQETDTFLPGHPSRHDNEGDNLLYDCELYGNPNDFQGSELVALGPSTIYKGSFSGGATGAQPDQV
jgi:hypothetical protein